MGQYGPDQNEQHSDRDGSSTQYAPGILDGDVSEPEFIAITDGYRNYDQSLPSGAGNFVFESYEPDLIESFGADDAELLLDRILIELGYVEIIRMYGYVWSVEYGGTQYGEIRAVSEHLDIPKNDHGISVKNGPQTAPSMKTAVSRVCGGLR